MRNDDEQRGRRSWPMWLAALRPEPAVRRRLRRRILASAAPLLGGYGTSWEDVAAGWSRALVPLAATVALVFGALAWSITADYEAELAVGDRPALSGDPTFLPWEAPGVIELAGSELQDPPEPLLMASAPDVDQILAAALYRTRSAAMGQER